MKTRAEYIAECRRLYRHEEAKAAEKSPLYPSAWPPTLLDIERLQDAAKDAMLRYLGESERPVNVTFQTGMSTRYGRDYEFYLHHEKFSGACLGFNHMSLEAVWETLCGCITTEMNEKNIIAVLLPRLEDENFKWGA